VFAIASVIAFKAVDGMRKERVAHQLELDKDQVERESQLNRGRH
jgi:hypothetical protein